MAKPKFPYVGDTAMRRFLKLHNCPTLLHVARMRFWGEIVNPSLQVSPVKTISSLWPDGLPTCANGDDANRFFQTLMGLWNHMAKHQDATSPVRLQQFDRPTTRDALREAAAMRIEELHDGFMHGFTGGHREMDVPSGVGDLLRRIETSPPDSVLSKCRRSRHIEFQHKSRRHLISVQGIVISGPVAELVGIEGGVVSGVFNLESSGVGAPDRRPRHEEHDHEA